MNSIVTAKTLAEKTKFASRNWFYRFREIPSCFSEKACESVASRLLKRYSKITKNWDIDQNSEWLCRLYLSAKMIMVATLQINSMHYAEDRNLRIVVPYLKYYSLLALLRSVVYTLPEVDWKDGELIRISHSAAIDYAIIHLGRFDRSLASSVKSDIIAFKAERELVSYRAPSSGDEQLSQNNRFLSLCTLLAEVAQFNSEILEASILKYADKAAFVLNPDYLCKISSVEIDGHYFGDTEDAYRLGYLARKYPLPANLMHLMTEGHVDDFFGAWHSSEETEDVFNPDNLNSIIFDIP
jgi:hypothetical protein